MTELAADNCITATELQQQSPASHRVFNYPLHSMHNLQTLIIARKQGRARSATSTEQSNQLQSLPRVSRVKHSERSRHKQCSSRSCFGRETRNRHDATVLLFLSYQDYDYSSEKFRLSAKDNFCTMNL